SDDDVRGAPAFADAMAAFAAFSGSRVLIGHTVAYDLTVLRREHERAGLTWTPPRALCTALLDRATG
ncbi:MAG: 3'-5' exonuclease, partial [Pseudomonadota bacterium]